jgi:hypothetical protein
MQLERLLPRRRFPTTLLYVPRYLLRQRGAHPMRRGILRGRPRHLLFKTRMRGGLLMCTRAILRVGVDLVGRCTVSRGLLLLRWSRPTCRVPDKRILLSEWLRYPQQRHVCLSTRPLRVSQWLNRSPLVDVLGSMHRESRVRVLLQGDRASRYTLLGGACMPRWKLRGNSVYDCGDVLRVALNGSEGMRCWYILRVEPKWDCLVLAVHGGAWFVLYCWLNEQCRCYMPFRIILQVRRGVIV